MNFDVYFQLLIKLKEITVNIAESKNEIYELQINVLKQIVNTEKKYIDLRIRLKHLRILPAIINMNK